MSRRAPSLVRRWFQQRYGTPTPAQKEAWPLIAAGRSVLIASPTGTGKTLAAFLSVLDQLASAPEPPPASVQCLYISPLRALAYDLEKNLQEPLREIYGSLDAAPIRVGMRTGDTSGAMRARQKARPPHILLTTPESLCVLLSQPSWLPVLSTVRWVIVDEIHALAEGKRGVHLTVSLERLAALRPAGAPLQRIGLSATVAPLEEVGKFLTGAHGECALVDAAAAKKIQLRVHTPLRKNPYPEAGYTGQRLIRELGQLIRDHRTTLVFTNTRSGAEASTFWLRETCPDLADVIECHHASLDRDVRQEVEDRLKRGELRAVVCSTSLELGIDIGSVDLVVMLATPKGVSRALQRTGRAGHNIHTISHGILMATNVNDLVEACATTLLARSRHLDFIRIPEAPLDILAQHLVSMGCERRWTRDEAFALVRSAWPYRDLTRADFDATLDYLAGGGKSLRMQYAEVFGKIELDDEGFQTRPGRVQREFLQNVGVIPETGVVHVRLKNRLLGSVEESFMRLIDPGDVFIIAGRPVRLERTGQMEAFVTRADGELPTIPRWNAHKMPLSAGVAGEISRFRGEIRRRLEEEEPEAELLKWIARRLDCGAANSRVIHAMVSTQHRLSEIPLEGTLLIEELLEETKEGTARPRHYFFHSLIGRAANDALSRVVARRLSALRGGNAISTPHDYGFVLTVAEHQGVEPGELREILSPEGFIEDFTAALERSEMLKYHFRNAAQTGLMVYRNFNSTRKPLRKLQWSTEVIFNVLQKYEPDHVLLRTARQDCAQGGFLDAPAALAYAENLARLGWPLRHRQVAHVPPLSFAMYATRIKEALHVEDPAETMERLFHQWWQELNEDSE
ncbi:MAG TPA: DEAD/DEAH box helicase [Chthoniobacteraceae bacterium]|nr:DEAD/DEAH box helicase [Chthoniobacteraceae bacterium]